MSHKARVVLLADNTLDFLATRAEYLERAGYKVLRASSVAEARNLLETRWVHVAILDIRLVDDNDQEDQSGIALAAEPAFRHIPKIMLTAFPHWEYVRRTMAAIPPDPPAAVNFLDKRESPAKMLDAVAQLFSAHLQINWDLAIHRSSRCNWRLLSLAETLSQSEDAEALQDSAQELEDLLRRLFCRSEEITLDQLLWQKGERAAFIVFAHAEGHPTRLYLVTCGARHSARREHETVRRLSAAAASHGVPTWVEYHETLHFGANRYELKDASLETAKPFAHFFIAASSREVGAAVDRLAQHCLRPWHQQPRIVVTSPRVLHLFGTENRLAWLEARLQDLGREMAEAGIGELIRDGTHMALQLARGQRHQFPDPVIWLSGQVSKHDQVSLPHALALNSLSVDTILVDGAGHPWLTDFGAVAEGPVWGDYAALETAFKFDLLDSATSLEDICEMEEVLLSAERLNQRLSPPMNKVAKVVSAVQHVRQRASEAWRPEMAPYLWELLYCSVERLRASTTAARRPPSELVPLVHTVLNLGMLCDRLNVWALPPSSAAGLTLDPERRSARVDGRPVSLTPSEYKLFEYLWRNAGKVCSRTELEQLLYGRPEQASGSDNLNMTINRLRQKIEPDPARPQYLKNVRGQGYILWPHGEPRP
ncbi:MAG: winged helix-turn-helix domain-containing protein [Caldilineales bacterium]|nr:winged helix-turn-helix domain-containing protein [Caldilineales bacterium]